MTLHAVTEPPLPASMFLIVRPTSRAIDARIARSSCAGVQVVTVVVGKADVYLELPWKAFALGASLAGARAVTSPTCCGRDW